MSAIRTASALSNIAAMSVRAGGALHTVASGKIRDATGVLRSFFGSISNVSLSKSAVFGKVNTSGSVSIQTQPVTVNYQGIVSTIQWTRSDTSTDTWTINSPNSATTTFTGGNPAPGSSISANFICTLTPPSGPAVVTGTVTATVTNIGYTYTGGGGGGGALP